jgi:NAD(P)H-hydrate epimerase
MRKLEEKAFKKGSTPEGLMEKAGCGIAAAILRRYPMPGTAIACIGSGNNGGDALVVIRYLAKKGWGISIRCLHEKSDIGELPQKKWHELGDCPVNKPLPEYRTNTDSPLILLDGLLGIGAKGPLRSPLDELAEWMNSVRESHSADTIAMDIPSGVNGDSGEVYTGAVIADLTLTIGVPKTGLFSHSAVNHTGSIESIPLAELPIPHSKQNSVTRLNDVLSLQGLIPRRPHKFHKGNAGRVGILAGSRGMLGAAVLCAQGALRAGAGLVTLFTEQSLYPLLAPMLAPEVMLKPITSLTEIENTQLDALALGPGLGLGLGLGLGSGSGSAWSDTEILTLLERTSYPTVIDADGLNRIALSAPEKHLRPNMIITPHPGEMARLFPKLATMPALVAAKAFTDQYNGVTLLLKGAHSLIAQSNHPHYLNGTGNSGMASGGQGDVLTGVITALLTQGIQQLDATRLGAWLCGRAAELAISHGGESVQSLTAGDVTKWLGKAFSEIS